jgi:tryptophan 2,3-dioxygenase
MTNHPPAEVLAARLVHELTTARIYAEAERIDMALRSIERAESVLAQLREALR